MVFLCGKSSTICSTTCLVISSQFIYKSRSLFSSVRSKFYTYLNFSICSIFSNFSDFSCGLSLLVLEDDRWNLARLLGYSYFVLSTDFYDFVCKASELAVMAAVLSVDNDLLRLSSRKFLSFLLWLSTVCFHLEIKLSINLYLQLRNSQRNKVSLD